MHRLPLADELPYRFLPPRANPLLLRVTRGFRSRILARDYRVDQIEFDGLDHLRPLLQAGDGVMIAPNHCDLADGLVMLSLGDLIGRPICAMAAYQIFTGNAGLRKWLFPRLGIFPVDREGADLAAVKAAIEILAQAEFPLLVFPEGEVYRMSDRLTSLREGVAFLAASAAKKIKEGQTVWIVPAGIKYRFLDSHDHTPTLLASMDRLEARFTWRPNQEKTLLDRIYRYAEGLLSLKELEYLNAARSGPIPERIASLRSHLLDRMEDRHASKRQETESVPVRVKELRRSCLEALKADATTPEIAHEIRRDLNDLFVAVQLFTYPGDYVRECPTVERAAETLLKFEEDVFGKELLAPDGPRRAVVKLGEPIDVGARITSGGKLKTVVGSITRELEKRIQALLDQIGPGRPL